MTSMSSKAKLLSGIAFVAAGWIGGWANTASAQELQEIIVTATKRESSAQKTPIALTPLASDDLRKAGVKSVTDLSGLAPSLSAANVNGQFIVTMRGVGNELLLTGAAESGVAVHANGVYQGTMVSAGSAYFDVDRVEILRGPQGTLWGRNSTGGAVNVIQNKPTEEFEGFVDFGYGRFNAFSVEGAAGGPLTDNIQYRAAVKYNRADGYLDNPAGPHDMGDDDTLSARLSVNFDLPNEGKLLLAAGHSRMDIYGFGRKQEGTAFAPGVPNTLTLLVGSPLDGSISFAERSFGPSAPRGKFVTYNTNPNSQEYNNLDYVTADLQLPLGAVDLASLTDYRSNKRYSLYDNDYSAQTVLEDYATFSDKTEEFSQELRLSNSNPGKIDWLAGLFYYHQNLQSDTVAIIGPFATVPDVAITPLTGGLIVLPSVPRVEYGLGGKMKVDSYAAFGQGTYRLTDDLSITGGIRYSYDKKSTDEYQNLAFDAGAGSLLLLDCPGAACPLQTKFSKDWDAVTGKLGIDYTLAPRTMVFASIARGYKSGGINLSGLSGPFDPETVWTEEVGVKSTLMDGRLQANVTAFHSDFKDYQLQSINGLALAITNADAKIYGLEAEATLLPFDGTRIKLVGSWNNSKIESFSNPLTVNPATLGFVTAGGKLPRTPEYSYRIDLEQDLPINDVFSATGGLSYRWQSDTRLDAFGTYGAEQGSYGLLDAFVSLKNKENSWSFDVYGKNLTDEFYKNSVYFLSAIYGAPADAMIGQPRTYGMRFRTQF